jgi:hypothetical protein
VRKAKERTVAFDENGVPVRRGKSKYITLDWDAIAALEILAPGPGAQGRVVSELLRAELCRREERARLRQAVLEALAEPVGASHD